MYIIMYAQLCCMYIRKLVKYTNLQHKNSDRHMIWLHAYLYPGWGEDQRKNCAYISHVAQVSDTAQVTRQVSLLGLIAWE